MSAAFSVELQQFRKRHDAHVETSKQHALWIEIHPELRTSPYRHDRHADNRSHVSATPIQESV